MHSHDSIMTYINMKDGNAAALCTHLHLHLQFYVATERSTTERNEPFTWLQRAVQEQPLKLS